MGEAKQRELSAIERRAALKVANTRPPGGPKKVLDSLGRPLMIGDAILVAEVNALNTLWRVMEVTPATQPQFQGGVWVEVVARTRVLCQPQVANAHVMLAIPVATEEPEVTSSGIILTDEEQT